MIGIVDYGMGNLHSVSKALERLNYEYFISENQDELKTADALILPGVGSFKDAMEILQEQKLDVFLKEWAASGKPLLGICLGMQLLFEESEENGETKGLSLLKGQVRRFKGITETGEKYKVPHMGWNRLKFHQNHVLLENVEQGHVYFVHSYVVQDMEEASLLASSEYDGVVPAVVGKDNVLGTQFHPEKSSYVGMKLLENFASIVTKQKEAKVHE
ncbi:imidazole glycerol phosphate synthase subunit HisH [Anaerobacillus alkalidiazotrophicus]|uniref:Imidazole glycerol phosphate synthase subunit HisH n=1 Tax=Anaerobacillus alkalidiazotrophicus TaxID=472963 RepID=A0A1S2M970_9BACI|nr:imidazole glycerol phosphate synthase subunit HisH [Anaerobacillus alkalidiazotrophicus]OIJ21023.1 imidazole glycerol phosphate synthase subunit HisH [Anaerobacillus alkalidiazotrophicus]